MKLILALLVALSVSAFAEEKVEEPWGYQCSNEEVLALAPSNLKIVGKSNISVSAIDTKAIKIDRKAKTATVWITYIAYPEMTANWARDFGQEFAELGYIKQLKVFDLVRSKSRSLSSTTYRCDGTNIETLSSSDWGYVVQDSIDDEMLKYLKKI